MELIRERDSGFALNRRSRSIDDASNSLDAISAANEIEFIRIVLRTSAADLAKCLGVSRQSLYNWKAGGQIKDKHADRVQQLKAAATVLAEANFPVAPLTLRRALPGGKTMLQTIAEGGDGAAAANSLLALLSREADQRQRLSARFKNRSAPNEQPDSYFFSENE
jgi:DNA-binding transcriptional regulator YiaG